MTRPISWSLPISTIGPPSTVATATLPVTRTQLAWGGFDNRSADFPGFIGQFSNPEAPLGFRLIPKLFFSRELSAAALSPERLNFSLLYQQRPLPGWELRVL